MVAIIKRFPYPGSDFSTSALLLLRGLPTIVYFNIRVSDMELASCFGAPRLRMATTALVGFQALKRLCLSLFCQLRKFAFVNFC